MRVLAFDLATKCGIALGGADAKPHAWSVDLGKKMTNGERFARAIRMTERYVRDHQPDIVAIEAPVGGRDTSAFLVGLIACVEGQATRMGVPVEQYFPASIRRHFLGKALTTRDFPGMSKAKAKQAIKQAVMDRCALLGWKSDDPDACDSLALLDFTLAKHRFQVPPAGALFAGRA